MKSPKPGQPLRLALDQNFPADLLDALQEWLPSEVELIHIARIDGRLSDLDDDELIVTLRQWGFDGLVTNNYKMLDVAHELVAIIATKAVFVATVAVGHDPIRAAGALLLELPGLPNRLLADGANIFYLNHQQRRPQPAWDYLHKLATKQGTTTKDLWGRYRPDLEEPVLAR